MQARRSSTGVTSSDGPVQFEVEPNRRYNLYLEGDQSYGTLAGNAGAMYIEVGVFQSWEEINNLPMQTPPAQIGSPMHADANGDGIVNEYDLVIPIQTSEDLSLTIRLSKNGEGAV